jgi:hypothetical protein
VNRPPTISSGSSVPLYRASLSHLAPEDRVTVACIGRRHFARLTPEYLRERGVSPQTLILDLTPRLRCKLCNELGRGMVGVEWPSRVSRLGQEHKWVASGPSNTRCC